RVWLVLRVWLILRVWLGRRRGRRSAGWPLPAFRWDCAPRAPRWKLGRCRNRLRDAAGGAGCTTAPYCPRWWLRRRTNAAGGGLEGTSVSHRPGTRTLGLGATTPASAPHWGCACAGPRRSCARVWAPVGRWRALPRKRPRADAAPHRYRRPGVWRSPDGAAPRLANGGR